MKYSILWNGWPSSPPIINYSIENVSRHVEGTPPRSVEECLAFIHEHNDVAPDDTISVAEWTPWNYSDDSFRPPYFSVLVFDGNDNLLLDMTDKANALGEGEVVLDPFTMDHPYVLDDEWPDYVYKVSQ